MIRVAEVDALLVKALPELGPDCAEYEGRRSEDPEFTQSFFGYSFIPTVQAAMDQDVRSFCERAFDLIENLVVEGDEEVIALLREEFFEYGPACEKWMRKGDRFMGPKTRALAQVTEAGSSS